MKPCSLNGKSERMRMANDQQTIEEIIRDHRYRMNTRRGYLQLLVRIILVLVLGYFLLNHVFLITQVHGNDMFPSMKDGDLIICYRLQRQFAKNDVVVYTENGHYRVGRVAARELDLLDLSDSGMLTVNGASQSGDILFPTYPREGAVYPYRVPEGMYYLLGDYRTKATDSRDHGPVSEERIVGKVITVLRRRGL